MAAPSPLVVKTVVVADDTEFVRDRFRSAIEHAGHRAVTASNRAELLTVLARNTPPIDLIVLDLRLAQGRGVELLHAIRQHVVERPIVVFSGTIASAGEVKELARLGVSGYLNEYTGAQHIVPALAPHLFPDGQNRRSSPRVGLGVSISYRVNNMIATGLSLNISTGGLAVRVFFARAPLPRLTRHGAGALSAPLGRPRPGFAPWWVWRSGRGDRVLRVGYGVDSERCSALPSDVSVPRSARPGAPADR